MKTVKISLPKFCNAMYTKLQNYLASAGIDKRRFLSFCFAVLLATKNRLSQTIPSLSLSEQDHQDLDTLYDLGLFVRTIEDGKVLLFGLAPGKINDDWLEGIEMLVNYFFLYHLLFKSKYKILEDDFIQVCTRFEELRSTYKVPGRFSYNKFIRRDNGNFSGGLTLTVSIGPLDSNAKPAPSDQQSDQDQSTDASDRDESADAKTNKPKSNPEDESDDSKSNDPS